MVELNPARQPACETTLRMMVFRNRDRFSRGSPTTPGRIASRLFQKPLTTPLPDVTDVLLDRDSELESAPIFSVVSGTATAVAIGSL